MTTISVDEFTIEKNCSFEGENYSVRDNGAVFRLPPSGKRPRSNDGVWTFGKENSANPYLHISRARIHRIVATAFHGEPLDSKYVVDHIDTNCRNNRPENLRWLTRLENTLKNPATRKKIEYFCGSVEAFLENPSILNDLRIDPNFGWMRTVTLEEAQNCKARMSVWATSESKPSGLASNNRKASFGNRAFKPLQNWEVGLGREPGLNLSKTQWCAQYMWKAAAYFPSCPEDNGSGFLGQYLAKLQPGAVLAQSDDKDLCPKLTVRLAKLVEIESSILVLSEREDSKWTVIGIELDKKSRHFIHYNLGWYHNQNAAETALAEAQNSQDWCGIALSFRES
jgi:hypothetical protein